MTIELRQLETVEEVVLSALKAFDTKMSVAAASAPGERSAAANVQLAGNEART